MSANKRKYYTITTTKIISANTKTDAVLKAQGRRGVDAEVLETFVDGERVSATEAKQMAGLVTS